MRPQFSPAATIASLATNVVAVAGALVTVATPLHDLLGAQRATDVVDVCLVIAALGSAHLSMSRSLLPSVDDPQPTAPSPAPPAETESK